MSGAKKTLIPALVAATLAACGPKPTGESESHPGSDATGNGDTGSNSGPGPVTSGQCPGDPATSTSGAASSSAADATTDSGSDLCPDHPVIDACCCFDGTERESIFPYAKVVCGLHRLCQEIVLVTDLGCDVGHAISTDCPAAIDCALEALIAGKPGSFSWRTSGEETSIERAVHIVGDGTAFTSGTYQCDLNGGLDPVEHRVLAPKAYFTACAGKPSVLDRFECVKDPFVDVALETCVEGVDIGPGF